MVLIQRMTPCQYKTQLLFFTLTEKNKTDVGIFIQVLFENLKIVQWVAGLTYHQPYRLPKAC